MSVVHSLLDLKGIYMTEILQDCIGLVVGVLFLVILEATQEMRLSLTLSRNQVLDAVVAEEEVAEVDLPCL